MKISKIKLCKFLFVVAIATVTYGITVSKTFYIYNKTFKYPLHIEEVRWSNCSSDKNFDIPVNGTKTIKWMFGTCTLEYLRFRTPTFNNYTFDYRFNLPISRSGQCIIDWDVVKNVPNVYCTRI